MNEVAACAHPEAGQLKPAAAKPGFRRRWSSAWPRAGSFRRASPAMITTYHENTGRGLPPAAGVGPERLVLAELAGERAGAPLSTHGARERIDRAGRPAGLGRIRPHGSRHSWATASTEATAGTSRRWRTRAAGRAPCSELDLRNPDWTKQPTAVNRVVRDMLKDVTAVHYTRSDTRELGYIDTNYWGFRFADRRSPFDLTPISQRWLRAPSPGDYLSDRLDGPEAPLANRERSSRPAGRWCASALSWPNTTLPWYRCG